MLQDSDMGKANVENSKDVIIWVFLLFGLTAVGALPFIIGHLNPDNLPEASPQLPLAFVGIIITAYAPSLAALLVTARVGGVRTLLSQIRTWRIRATWYLLVLIGPMILILLAD